MAAVKRVATEHQEQAALFAWAVQVRQVYPELRLMFAIPNGAALAAKTVAGPNGARARFSREAMKLRAEGLKAGVPDICLPVARAGFHALYIEMKRVKGGQLSVEQKRWIADLTEQDVCVVCCKGWEVAREVIRGYLKDQDPRAGKAMTEGVAA